MVAKQEIQQQLEHLGNTVNDKFIQFFNDFDKEELYNRKNFVGHITASGSIIHLPSREILLLHHKTLDKWLIPGGHVDPDDKFIIQTALREIEEETGLTTDQLIPMNTIDDTQYCVEINSHPIPRNEKKKEEAHYHHDFRFLFGYTGDKLIGINTDESLDYKWLSIDDPYLNEIVNTPVSIDKVLLEGLEKYELAIQQQHHNDYLVTPLARYTFRLGITHFDHGELEVAEQMFRKSIEAFENTYDDEYETPPSILSALWNLAIVYKKTNRQDLELATLQKGLEKSKEFAQLDENFQSYVAEFTEYIALRYHSTGQL